jgi:DNA-binding transcriptional MerR regulator
MNNLTLKAGQVAAALNISTKRLQNTVDAGYLRPALAGRGRGSERRYSFEDVVRMQALEILVNSYGLSAPRAARMLSDVWPRRFSRRPRVLVIRPEPTLRGVKLEPIKLPLDEIAAAAEARIQQVLADYGEKKRGRPAGWSAKFTRSLSRVSGALQDVSDEQIEDEIAKYRRERRARKK